MPVVIAAVAVRLVIPESPVRTPARLDWRGALALSGALVAFLLALSEGERWGWLSVPTLGLLVASAALAVGWVRIELRVAEPMVDIAMMRHPSVFWASLAAVLTGFAMFGTFLLVPAFVQAPEGLPAGVADRLGYGFGADVITAGLYLLPASAVMLVVGPIAGLLERRVGARSLTISGLVVLGAGAVALAAAHDTTLAIVLAMLLVGIGVGLVYAALAKLVVDAVRPEVTGVALGMNTVMRTIGGVVGGQVGAAILSGVTLSGTSVPAESAFTVTFAVAAVVALAGAVGATRLPRRAAGARAVGEPARA